MARRSEAAVRQSVRSDDRRTGWSGGLGRPALQAGPAGEATRRLAEHAGGPHVARLVARPLARLLRAGQGVLDIRAACLLQALQQVLGEALRLHARLVLAPAAA